MGWGYRFRGKKSLEMLADKYVGDHPDREYQLDKVKQAYEEHKKRQDEFYDFLIDNQKKTTKS